MTTTFVQNLSNHKLYIKRNSISTLQINIGKRCNQACHHCHVEAGPKREENMDLKTISRILELVNKTPSIKTVDITGGAPELNPHFRHFVENSKKLNKNIIDRCNLTILLEKGQEDTALFLAKNNVEIIASLPCYEENNVNKQRGRYVFNKSIKALKILNSIGYGKKDSDLILNLVYNPVGEHLPPEQLQLELDYKKSLKDKYNIEFNSLFTITNMPINRYAHSLKRNNKYDNYMKLLMDNFNTQAIDNVMCKNLVSIAWDGVIYDCDFNQMLGIDLKSKITIWDITNFNEVSKNITLADHCYACTAGSGSSCTGVLV